MSSPPSTLRSSSCIRPATAELRPRVGAARVTTAPFRFVSLLLGAVSLLTLISTLFLGDGSPMTVLGIGGIERWIVYPMILWVIDFGGYLSGRADGDRTAGAK